MLERTRPSFFETNRGFAPDGVISSEAFSLLDRVAKLWRIPETAPPPPVIHPKPPEIAVGPMSPAQAMVDVDLLKMAFPQNSREALAEWLDPTVRAMVRWGIDTFREVASFLANIGVESAGLTRLEENLNYSAKRMAEVWPGRFALNPRAPMRDRQPNALAKSLAHNPEKLANHVYANRMGNGPPASGDGWRHRGFGPKQVTGKDNQSALGEALGIPLAQVPAYLRTKEGGMMGAGWFWKTNDLDAKAATPGMEDDRRTINGGLNGLAEVDAIFDRLVDELLRRERASK